MKGNFLLIVVSSFLFLISTHLLVPMLPVYLRGIGVLEDQVGFIVGLVALTAVFTRIPVGRFIDRRGRRGMLLAGMVLQLASPFLYSLCADTAQFTVVRVLNGVGFAAFIVTAQTMVVDMSPKGRLGEVLGIYSVCFLAAQALGPALSGLLFSGLDYTAVFYISGAMALAAALLALRIQVPPHLPSKTAGLGAVLRNRNLLTSSLALMAVLLPHGVLHAFFPLYAASRGVGLEGVGLFFMVYAIFTNATRPFVGALSDRVGRVAVAVPATVLAAAGIGVFTVAGDLPGFMAAGVALGTGMGASISALFALSVDTVSPELRGQAVAVSGTAIDMGISIGSMGMGPLVLLGGYSLAFTATALVILAGLAAFLGVRAVWRKSETTYT